MKKKKILPVIIIILLIAAIAVFVILFTRKKDDKEESGEMVYVESVADITGMGLSNMDRFMGTVESQDVKYVDKQQDKTVKEIFVEEGTQVSEGDKLFEYDTEAMALQLRQLELELTSINNSITTANQQINTLAKEREEAPAEEKIDYTTQIQSIQTQINQYNYDASCKQLEIDRQKSAMENATVFSPMDGIVQKINKDSNSSGSSDYVDYGYGSGDESDNHFISIMALGDYRVKCTGDEMNVRSLYVDQPMIVMSRTEEGVSWTGSISEIDLENPVTNNNNYYDGGETTTKYSFYIQLNSTEGMMLGQHVYAEMDFGQGEAKSGLWLYEYYIVQDGDMSYVWAEDEKGKIEKRVVQLGEYDENLMRYEITSGLSVSDYIAFPEDRIKVGMKTTTNYEDVMPDMEDGMFEDGMMEDGMMEDGMIEDGMIEDGMMEDGINEDGIIDDEAYEYDNEDEETIENIDNEGNDGISVIKETESNSYDDIKNEGEPVGANGTDFLYDKEVGC